MATHSSIFAWTIPWTEEPSGLQSMGSQRVGHDWVTSLSFLVFLPGKFHRQRNLVGYSPRGCKESNMTEHSCTSFWYATLKISVVFFSPTFSFHFFSLSRSSVLFLGFLSLLLCLENGLDKTPRKLHSWLFLFPFFQGPHSLSFDHIWKQFCFVLRKSYLVLFSIY